MRLLLNCFQLGTIVQSYHGREVIHHSSILGDGGVRLIPYLSLGRSLVFSIVTGLFFL